MLALVASEQQRQFGRDKLDTPARVLPGVRCALCLPRRVPQEPLSCETPDGEPGLNYLCAGYKPFFHHVDRPDEDHGHSAADKTAPQAILCRSWRPKKRSFKPKFAKAGRNDPCPCGSGLKFKHCHGKNT